jgi:hypothetical protein
MVLSSSFSVTLSVELASLTGPLSSTSHSLVTSLGDSSTRNSASDQSCWMKKLIKRACMLTGRCLSCARVATRARHPRLQCDQ